MLRDGVCGYLLKRSVAEELLLAIRAASRKEIYLTPSVSGPLLEGLTDGQTAGKDEKGFDELLVMFLQEDSKTVDVSRATVVVLYLPTPGNLKLRQMLREQLPVGARIVSRRTDMVEWASDKSEFVDDANGAPNLL